PRRNADGRRPALTVGRRIHLAVLARARLPLGLRVPRALECDLPVGRLVPRPRLPALPDELALRHVARADLLVDRRPGRRLLRQDQEVAHLGTVRACATWWCPRPR